MDAINKGTVEQCVTGLAALQAIQQSYDEVGWRMSTPEFRKYRHIAIHLAKYIGELSAIAEQWEHAAYDKGLGEDGVIVKSKAVEIGAIVGSLLYHAAQLSSLSEKSISECFLTTVSANARRFAPDSVFPHLIEMASQREI